MRDETKWKSWLFTVLRREFLHRSRDHSRQNHYPLELVEGELPPITVDHAAGMDARSLLAVLQGLEEHFRMPLSLFYFEQLSYKEIAVIMETPLGTVMSRLARGKQMLRQRLEQTRVPASAGEHKIIPLTGEASRPHHG